MPYGVNYGISEARTAIAVTEAMLGTMINCGTLYGETEARLGMAIAEAFVDAGLGLGGGGGNQTGIVQVATFQTGSFAQGTIQMPYYSDFGTTLNTDGNPFMELSITPTSTTNRLIVEVLAQLGASNGGVSIGALFQDSISEARAINYFPHNHTTAVPFPMRHTQLAGTTNLTTFKFRAGRPDTTPINFNGEYDQIRFNGKLASTMIIYEVIA